VDHSYEHRGQTGKFKNVYTVDDVPLWQVTANAHELAVIPYYVNCDENSIWRRNSDLNDPFSDDEFKDNATFDYKLSILVHSNIGINQDSVVCLRTVRERCPVCEEHDRIEREEPENEERLSSLRPRKKCLYNIVVFDNDAERDKGIQVWEAPHASIEDVLAELAKRQNRRSGEIEYKDYTVPDQGFNVCFERVGTGLSTEYRQVAIEERLKDQEFTDKELNALYDMAYNFEDVVELKTFEEIYEMVHGVALADGQLTEEQQFRGRPGGQRRGREETTPEEETPPDRGARRRERQAEERGGGGEERTTRTRGTRTPAEAETVGSEDPECFGKDCNQLSKCEECPEDMFVACFKKYEASG
jgi:hypothetical protein